MIPIENTFEFLVALIILVLIGLFPFLAFNALRHHHKRQAPRMHIHIISLDDLNKPDEPEGDGPEDVRLSRYYSNLYMDLVDYAERLSKQQ